MTSRIRLSRMYFLSNHIKAFALSFLLICMLTGCSTQKFLTEKAGDLLSKETLTTEEDLELLMHASAYHLKLSESLLKEIPHHLKLSESVTRGFTQYAFVFLMDEADRIESESVKKSTLLRMRAAKMLIRAKSNGLETLKLKYVQLDQYLQSSSSENVLTIDADDVGLAYWVMTSWAGAISLSKDNPDMVADLPQAFKLANLVWQTYPKFDQGSLASMMGNLELAKPGHHSKRAEEFFDLGIEWRGNQIAPLVSKAENWAVATQNKDAFLKLLTLAIREGQDKTDLTNTIMTRRAKWLLESTDNLF